MTVVNRDNEKKRPVQVGSHYHFFEVNDGLEFEDADRATVSRDFALGMRLNVPAGSSVRFEYEVPVEVQLVPIEGQRKVHGLREKTKAMPIPPLPSVQTGGQ
ncbi:urease subunit beta [Streptomyces sp. NPDC006267]|uniref:urease subunit beta n=1 Tax=unclassified Streptomyces TaxID=2593676 RepID=UPI0033B4EF4A